MLRHSISLNVVLRNSSDLLRTITDGEKSYLRPCKRLESGNSHEPAYVMVAAEALGVTHRRDPEEKFGLVHMFDNM